MSVQSRTNGVAAARLARVLHRASGMLRHAMSCYGNEPWEILERLVAFDTVPTSSNVAAAEYLADLLDDRGFGVGLHRDVALGADKASLVAWAGPARPDGLIVSGHLDVVPFADQPGWTRDPLRLSRDDGRVYGRGVADMKGFLAQSVAVARGIDRDRLERPLVLLVTCDEEVGCLGCGRLLPHLEGLLEGVPLPKEAVIGEPTAFRVYSAHKGHLAFTVEIRGRGGHSSRPDLGTSAVAAMVEAAYALNGLALDLATRGSEAARELFPDFPGVPLNLGVIRGGTADNMIAERCVLTVGIRPLPEDDPLALLAEAKTRMREVVVRAFPGAELTVGDVEVTPAMRSPRSGRVASLLSRLTGDHALLGAPFATDGGQLQRLGVHSYICGPGELEQAHQPNESLTMVAFERGLDLLGELVRALCGG
jgi:acetylornithine deacetylase